MYYQLGSIVADHSGRHGVVFAAYGQRALFCDVLWEDGTKERGREQSTLALMGVFARGPELDARTYPTAAEARVIYAKYYIPGQRPDRDGMPSSCSDESGSGWTYGLPEGIAYLYPLARNYCGLAPWQQEGRPKNSARATLLAAGLARIGS
jgi:hypothetical protein